jgi:hypothetical protein
MMKFIYTIKFSCTGSKDFLCSMQDKFMFYSEGFSSIIFFSRVFGQCGIESRTVATLSLAVRRSPSRLDFIHKARSHPQARFYPFALSHS